MSDIGCLADLRGAQDRITEGKARAWPQIAIAWSSATKIGRAGACGRGWPCAASGLPFEEINVRLRQAESKAEIIKYSPSGLVPLLLDGDLAIWDSLAIIEYLAEQHPDKRMWPADRQARALARSVSAEIHSGFAAAAPGRARWRSWPTTRSNPVPEDGRDRHPPHRRALAGVPREVRRRRAVPVRRILGRRCDVCAGRLAFPHLHARPWPLRRRRHGRRATWRRSSPCRRWPQWIDGARAQVAAQA